MDEPSKKATFPGSDRTWTIFGALFGPGWIVFDLLFLKTNVTTFLFQNGLSTGFTCIILTLISVTPFLCHAQKKYKATRHQLDRVNEKAKKSELEEGQYINFMKVVFSIFKEFDYIVSFQGSKKHPFFTKHSKTIIEMVLAGATNIALQDKSNIMKALVLEPNKNGKRLKLMAMTMESSSDKRNIDLDRNRSFAGDCMNSKKKIVCNSTNADAIDLHDLKDHKRIKSIACFPIMFTDEVLGVFCITSQLENSFKDKKFVGYLEFFTEILALVMRLHSMADVVCEKLVLLKTNIPKGALIDGKCRFEKVRS